MVKFSLVAPIYKVESYLTKCIESMLQQSYKNIEIILVDDGSPDNCGHICDTYAVKDDRVKVVHKSNGGLVSARQAGVAIATGDYIINVDGDDWISVDYCQVMAAVIEKYTPDIVACGHYKEYENRTAECKLPYRYGLYMRSDMEQDIFPLLIQNEKCKIFSLSLWGKAIRRELQHKQQMLVDTRISVGEDIVCTAPCVFQSNSIYIVEECLYHYRQNPVSMTKAKKPLNWDDPEIRGTFLQTQIDTQYSDFEIQICRYVTHAVFNVAKSQFNREIGYRDIKKEIKRELNRPYYRHAIRESRFKGVRPNIMRLTLKYNMIFALKILNKVM